MPANYGLRLNDDEAHGELLKLGFEVAQSIQLYRWCPSILRCRSAAFSASSRLFDLNGTAKTARTKLRTANIAP